MSGTPAVIFDLDGTLIDSAPDIMGIANGLLAEEGRAPLSLAETRSFVGRGAPVFIQRMRAARDIPETRQEALLSGFTSRYNTATGLTEIYPGAVAALEELIADGCVLGICTNKPIGPTHAVLKALDLARFFPVVLGGDSLAVRKPHPEPLHAALREAGGGPRVYVGDSETDAETAQNAGVPFLLFTLGYRQTPAEELPHAALFDDHAALPALVRQHMAPG